MRAAAVQLNSTGAKERNLAAAERLVREAAADGADLVALPEKWNLLAAGEELLAGAEPLDGPSLTAARSWARELGIHLLAGSICERGVGDRAANTSVMIGPDGDDLAVYRKIHMFDVDAGGVSYRESEHERPGEEIVTAPVAGTVLGLAVCYDLRFPELFRLTADATDLFVVIANWPTRRARAWRALLAARSIDAQAWVLGVNRVGEAEGHPHRGDTSLLDPWGEVVATLTDEAGAVLHEVDAEVVRRAREHFPFLRDRRPDLYRRLEGDD
jgi:predicted amidohydrolase